MTYQVRVHDLFRQDVDELIDWFEEAVVGLGSEFADAVDNALDRLVARPNSHRVVIDTYRRVLIPRFRALVLFMVEGDRIYVAGVLHASRDLRAWVDRRFSPADE